MVIDTREENFEMSNMCAFQHSKWTSLQPLQSAEIPFFFQWSNGHWTYVEGISESHDTKYNLYDCNLFIRQIKIAYIFAPPTIIILRHNSCRSTAGCMLIWFLCLQLAVIRRFPQWKKINTLRHLIFLRNEEVTHIYRGFNRWVPLRSRRPMSNESGWRWVFVEFVDIFFGYLEMRSYLPGNLLQSWCGLSDYSCVGLRHQRRQ